MALDNIGEAGQIKRKTYQRRLPENPNLDYYYIIRETGNVEPLLVEYGFIDNTRDARKLQSNLENYVEGVVKALTQYLRVPYFPPNSGQDAADYYTVQRGDTLYGIARKFNTTVAELKRINNLTSDTLSIGQKLIIFEKDNNIPTDDSLVPYEVKKGDSLWKISREYGISVEELKQINNLDTINLQIGDILLVPNINKPSENVYAVQPGYTIFMGNNE